MKKVVLDGNNLTVDKISKIARDGYAVEISEEAYARIVKSREFVYEMLNSDVPVYGFNRGVGLNKDREIFERYYEEYNRNLVLAHTLGVGPDATLEETRAILVARLNNYLLGYTGAQPKLVERYAEFINRDILPQIPKRGSVGEADITCLSHIGLAAMGEGNVYYKGKLMTTKEAYEIEGLEPIVLGPKDGLAIVSSNALAAGEGALVLKDVQDLLDMADLIYAMSLEGLKGNVTPLDESTHKIRPFPGQNKSADNVRRFLEGSYLYLPGVADALQDPLSFRGSCQIHGAVRDSLEHVEKYLHLHLNTSEDNPCVLVDERRMVACANYEPTTWAIGFEMLGIALSHLSKAACHRTIKLARPKFTGLSRFLTPADTRVIAYGTIQKVFTSLDTEIRHLSNPVTADFFSVAGDIEDHANNTPLVVQKTTKIVDNLFYILGIELMHAAQAMDLRKVEKAGKYTKKVWEAFRKEVSFLEEDRNLSVDINKSYNFIKSKKIIDIINE
ncbi:HAL/PAL/TAL family ammonia-lyase [Anaeromicrobium sediminis]|uniref:Phenylalanine ammonia-lyase n=1 Tax=Anaeromicrobium sediminis TaxID=1478221 RepID=A0A267MKA2_9FIRM|nr:aromatic amino acid ammonia-lyase [Anaeromicrobium sediminis]PAB59315.1 phenylalanine ammonia-lyase [Anaeromicrobium sediminis]